MPRVTITKRHNGKIYIGLTLEEFKALAKYVSVKLFTHLVVLRGCDLHEEAAAIERVATALDKFHEGLR